MGAITDGAITERVEWMERTTTTGPQTGSDTAAAASHRTMTVFGPAVGYLETRCRTLVATGSTDDDLGSTDDDLGSTDGDR